MPLHYRAFLATVIWTLGLLWLGSVVHATESSLACPDWPTCFGTMMPEMSGGVFWEHLHRLVAGGLILIWGTATWQAYRHDDRRSVRRAAVAGIGLLLVQSTLGGITVIYRLPDAVSTSHLSLAFAFLTLATILTVATSPARGNRAPISESVRRILRVWGPIAAVGVFAQSVIGALVRHTDSGMACPDLPTCIGEWVPPLDNRLIAIHFTHRVVAVLVTLLVLTLAIRLLRSDAPMRVRRAATAAIGLVLAQFTLGLLSVTSALAVVPVSLHTLGAALLLVTLTALSVWGRVAEDRSSDRRVIDLEPGSRTSVGA